MSQVTIESKISAKDRQGRLMNLLKEIEQNPAAINFAEPVPYMELGLTNYPQIIKRPMDISTCRKNLAKCRYNSYKEFFADIQLIWDNCKQYNVVGSDIYELAVEMEKHAKKLVAKVRRQLGQEEDAPAKKVVAKAKKPSQESSEEEASSKAKTGKKQTNKTTGPAEENDTAEETDGVSFEDKVAFTEKVRKLDNDGLTRLVKRINKICKDALEDVDEDKLHIEVDRIDKASFGQLSTLVDECLSKKRARR